MKKQLTWDDEHEIVLVNLTLGEMSPATLNGRYEHKTRVDKRTGEVLKGCLQCHEHEQLLIRKERVIRGLELQLANLQTDQEARARAHPRWKEISELYDLWKRECNHPRMKFSADEFRQAQTLYEEHGRELCERAIRGAGYDPWTSRRRNGTKKRHDDWGLIFRNQEKFAEFCNRAPKGET